jgi:hypothetical protein
MNTKILGYAPQPRHLVEGYKSLRDKQQEIVGRSHSEEEDPKGERK